MKRLLLIFISLQIATGNLLVCELSKLPFIVQHYCEHKTTDKEINFFDFVVLHYFDYAHKKSDPSHKNLPLQHEHSTHSTVEKNYVSMRFALEQLPILIIGEKPTYKKENLYSIEYYKRLFRPPSPSFLFIS